MERSEEIELYLVRRAKQCLKEGDSYMAKAWFLTASNLCPSSFKVQFERYLMAKEEHNVSEASQYFINLIGNETKLSTNSEIDQEMSIVVDAIKNNKNNVNSAFYRQLFETLTPSLQQQLLVSVASKYHEMSDVCQLTLLTLKKFPGRINEDGLKLVKILTTENEETQSSNYSQKYYRQLLVFDVLPVILTPDSNLEISEQQLYKLLEKSISLYVEINLISQSSNCEMNDKCGSSNDNVDNRFVNVFYLIASKLGWELNIFDKSIENSVELQYQKILSFYQNVNTLAIGDGANAPIDLSASNTSLTSTIDETSMKQVLYSVIILFLICLNKYARETVGKLVLVEKRTFSFNNDNPTKKRKLSYSFHSPEIHTNNEELAESLVGAVKCFELINNDYNLLKGTRNINLSIHNLCLTEFSKQIEVFGLLDSEAHDYFILDSHLYKASYQDLIALLTNSEKYQLKSCLQRISSSLMLYNDMDVIQSCISCVSMIQKMSEKSEEKTISPSTSAVPQLQSGTRSLIFLNYTSEDILGYCVDALITCIKNKEMLSIKPSDEGIGHLIVLSQHKWPKEVELFEHCISIIKKSCHSSQPKFVYPLFFDYIVNPDILEEFMALVNLEGFCLELKGKRRVDRITNFDMTAHAEQSVTTNVTSKGSSKSMTTRGINKNVKEEIRNALMSQMRNSKIVIEKSLLINFILTEINTYITR